MIRPHSAAFPRSSGPEPRVNEYHEAQTGLTIREEFAARFYAALLTGATIGSRDSDGTITWVAPLPDGVAQVAVEHADALITALNRRGTGDG